MCGVVYSLNPRNCSHLPDCTKLWPGFCSFSLGERKHEWTLNAGCFPQYLASCSSQSQKPVVVHFPASVPLWTRSSLRIALLWQCLSFCNRTANMMFSHEEECSVPRCSIWKTQDCCVLFLIIRCQRFKTEQCWRVLLLQMLLVQDVKPCSAFLHPTWNELDEADNENAAFY